MRSLTQKKQKVIVGMSGGVDSSVAAALLKKEGYEVTGVFMKNWADPKYPCPWQEDRRDAMRVSAILDIPFETWDFTKEYRASVVDYMVREYAAGRTPNPDVMCNSRIKFGDFLQCALKAGADFIATGHYVRLMRKSEIRNPKSEMVRQRSPSRAYRWTNSKFKIQNDNSKFKILEATDRNKDQTYFLWALTQKELRHALFPIGNYTKPEVRELAKKFGLPTAEKPDSQGICFVGEIDVAVFLRDHIPSRRGAVLTASGKKIGEHDGVQFYTIGQRHGIGVGGGIPFYVAGKDIETNTLMVAEGPNDNALFSKKLTVESINWISGNSPQLPLECEARIRYRQPLQFCRIERIPADNERIRANHKSFAIREDSFNDSFIIRVFFKEEQRAVTPGQSVVFYKDGVMLGGGIIA